MSRRRRRGIGSGLLASSGLIYLLRDSFLTDAAAPLTSPRAAEPGPGTLTITDTGATLAITSGIVTPNAAAVGNRDPYVRDASGLTRVAGRMFQIKVKRSGSLGADSGNPVVGFTTNLTATASTMYGLLWSSAGGATANAAEVGAFPANSRIAFANDTFYVLSFLMDTTGWKLFVDSKLVWKGYGGTTTPLYPAIFPRSANDRPYFIDYWYERDVLALADFTPCTVNVASPTDAALLTATANQIIDMDVTAPGTLANECGIKYRILDANNYWRAYFDAAGAFKVDSVAAGTPTNQISVAGVITTGATRKIQIINEGSIHGAYTWTGAVPTKRGSDVNVSHQNTQTAIAADIGATWTAANLRSYPLDASNYSSLLSA